MTPEILRTAVLKILADHDGLVTEKYVAVALAVEFGLKVTYSEVRDVLAKLDESKYLVSVRRNDGVVLWSVTGLGKSVLSEIR